MRASSIDDLTGISAGALLLDPPVRLKSWSAAGEGRSPQRHYLRSTHLDQIADLPIRKIAGLDCWVLAWIPLPHVRAVPRLFDAWGVKLSGPGLTWIKTNRDGWIFKGNGYSFRANTEVAWLGRIGAAPERVDRGVSLVIVAPRGRYSAKPVQQYKRIERLAGPDKIFVELFARDSGPPTHWRAAGHELDRDATSTATLNEEPTPTYDSDQAAGDNGWRRR